MDGVKGIGVRSDIFGGWQAMTKLREILARTPTKMIGLGLVEIVVSWVKWKILRVRR